MKEQKCSKRRFPKWSHALAWATMDEKIYKDKRKAYFCRWCQSYHVSRERIKTDVPLLER